MYSVFKFGVTDVFGHSWYKGILHLDFQILHDNFENK